MFFVDNIDADHNVWCGKRLSYIKPTLPLIFEARGVMKKCLTSKKSHPNSSYFYFSFKYWVDGPIGMSVACLGVMVNLVAIVVLARQRVQRTFHLLMIFLSGIRNSDAFWKGIFDWISWPWLSFQCGTSCGWSFSSCSSQCLRLASSGETESTFTWCPISCLYFKYAFPDRVTALLPSP